MEISEFKSAVGKYPTGVTIISTCYQDILYGFTANTFTSVSLDPPLILFCLNKNAGSLKAFVNSDFFAINILTYQQHELAIHFSSPRNNKFAKIDFLLGEYSGAPLINDVASILECHKTNQIEAGDHLIFIGQVHKIQINNNQPPLIYFAKSYRDLK